MISEQLEEGASSSRTKRSNGRKHRARGMSKRDEQKHRAKGTSKRNEAMGQRSQRERTEQEEQAV